eukprot:622180-Rhodomonas_salina.3
MSGTGIAYAAEVLTSCLPPRVLQAWYAMSGTDIEYPACTRSLRDVRQKQYEMKGWMGKHPVRSLQDVKSRYWYHAVPAYARPTECAVLTWRGGTRCVLDNGKLMLYQYWATLLHTDAGTGTRMPLRISYACTYCLPVYLLRLVRY